MARQQARRQRRERVAGVVLAVLGAVVLIIAIMAIAEPKDGSSNNAASAPTRTVTQSPSPSTKPSSPSTSTTPSSQRGSASLSLGADSSPAGSSGSGSNTDSVKSTPLVVLNNTTTSGLAKDAAARFRSAGWTVSDTGNLTNNIISTCAYYDPDISGAKAAAQALQDEFPTIKRVAKKFSGLPSGPVVVVLTSDYSSS